VNHIRVLGIIGSPRRGGNTETLVDAVLTDAEEAGGRVEKVLLRDRSAELTAKPGNRPLPGLRRMPADRDVRAGGRHAGPPGKDGTWAGLGAINAGLLVGADGSV
jgi:hypothetical protein